ncbi:glycosyltransferase [Flavobacterium aquidurense]|uniref:glycosyltransferase n=1 Tax=Flavobacterium aquidurense TaxID=362413 RepID=UPI00285E0F75|nr:glycosyltransferase [Flavobacterium aquidurense]MDR7372309.1 glycosyltransferase involved in cell wall biosynthesis [Flavobacterium aquidurense]
MKFAIITHVPHIVDKNHYFAYAPYVKEMNIWGKYVDEFIIVAPINQGAKTVIDIPYDKKKIVFLEIDEISLIGWMAVLNSILKSPKICWQIYIAMQKANHIHLRCPGNIGLLGCLIQILFPGKPKTAKYAGNWDPEAKQPWSYRLQKWILNNSFLTRNMQVLVYGEWQQSSKNIKPFFTATYSESDKMPMKKLDLNGKINFVFVGTLVSGKNPLFSIQFVEALFKKGYNVTLQLYGEGIERKRLEEYIVANKLENYIELKGNQNQIVVSEAYANSHFVILPSKSEGWPKAVAEGMFWGCIPMVTSVSCVPFMLDYGKRGVLLETNMEQDIQNLESILNSEMIFEIMREKASKWSRKYTIDSFETEIKKLLLK